MLRVVCSNRTEALLEALVTDLAARRESSADPLEPIDVVVPNRNVEAWLKLQVARRAGIAANLRCEFLRALLARLVRESAPGQRLVEGDVLLGLVLALLLDDDALAHADLGAVRDYLRAGGSEGAIDVRRHQLATRLAHLFEEYAYSRAEMLAAWQSGGAAADPVALWQRRLWLAIFGAGGLLQRRAAQSRTRAIPLHACLEALALAAGPPLHVFGLSYVAPLYHRVFARLADARELVLYALVPTIDAPETTERERETRAVDGWARPTRENLLLLKAAAHCEIDARWDNFANGDAPTLLRRLQRDVVRRELDAGPCRNPGPASDDSVTVLACPSVRREAEIIAREIWSMMRRDDALRLCDIAVVLAHGAPAERGVAFAHLEAAFRECHDIPHNVVDLALDAKGRVPGAVRLLLDLPLGDFTRPELLRLVTHPSLMARFPDAEPGDWLAWCDRLGVLHGADSEDHAATYIERDVLNWDQGMRRLALGAFMAGARSGDGRVFALGSERYLPEEHAQSSHESAAGLGLLVRSLVADARFAARGPDGGPRRMRLADWSAFLRQAILSYVAAEKDDDNDDARDLQRVLLALRRLDDMDLGDRPVCYRLAHALASAAIGEVPTVRGQHLGDGVTISSLRSIRAIPFRAIFVAGLGQGSFPSPSRRDQLDLRAMPRRPGDVSPREQDATMLLETLLCARDRLVLSYVARDPITGDTLEPSPIVLELCDALARRYPRDGAWDRLVRTPPLRRHAEVGVAAPDAGVVGEDGPPIAPEAWREADAAALGLELRARLGGREATGQAATDLEELRERLSPESLEALRERLGAPAAPPAAAPDRSSTVIVSLSLLRRFLECPLQGSARLLLGLDEDDDDDPTEVEDEPFALAPLELAKLLRHAFDDVVAGKSTPERAYDEHALRLELGGVAPTGFFGRVAREEGLGALRAWVEIFESIEGRAGAVRVAHFGKTFESPPIAGAPSEVVTPDEFLEPIVFDDVGPGVRVELHGTTDLLVPAVGSLRLVARASDQAASSARTLLSGFLTHVALAAAGRGLPDGHRAIVAHGDGKRRVRRFAPMAREEARAYLEGLVVELLSRVHDYLLPCEAVFAAEGGDVVAAARALANDDRAHCGSSFGPVPHWRTYRPPPDGEARAMVLRRFGPFLAGKDEKAVP